MSGIAGIIHFDGKPVEPGLIEKMTSAMAHRGPDGINHWVNGSVALGQCMLRTTPESLEEHQPLTSEDESLVLVMDGRVDNREELQGALRGKSITLRDNTDAELVLRAYEVWGEDSPNRILGDFAFAVWDNAQQRLFCARDHMGARPFYFVRSRYLFAVASEEEAFTGMPGVSNRPNEELIAYYLEQRFLDFDCSRSWLRDVWPLPSASHLSISIDGKMRQHTYWKLEPGEERIYQSDNECQEDFLNIFGEAVRCRLRSSGDVAAMVSGGMDSASIVAMVKRLLNGSQSGGFHTYSAISDSPESSIESQSILSLTSGIGSAAHYVSVPSFRGMLSVDDLIETGWGKVHPVDNDILLPAMMCLAASRDNHRVMLCGVCGDLTLYAPKRYIRYLLLGGRWREAWRECRSASRNHTFLHGTSSYRLLLRYFLSAYVPGGIQMLGRRLRSIRLEPPFVHSLINPEFAKELNLAERIKTWEINQTYSVAALQNEHIKALQPPHSIASALTGYGRVAGRHGMELRDPWGDKRVVEFFLKLPINQRVRGGWTKYLPRTVFSPDLESFVRFRSDKEHVGWFFSTQLMAETGEHLKYTMDSLLPGIQNYVDPKKAKNLFTRYIEFQDLGDAQWIYEIITLANWLAQREKPQ